MKKFFYALLMYVKRGICSPMFWMSILVSTTLMIFFVYLDYRIDDLEVGLYYFLQGVDASGAGYLLLTIIAFPAVTLFYDDFSSGYFKFSYARFGKQRYSFTVSFASGIIAATAMFVSYCFFSLFILTKYPLVPDINSEELRSATLGFPNSGLLTYNGGLLCYMLFFLTKSSMAAFFSTLAILQSMIITNRYLTIISPIFTHMILFSLLGGLKLPTFINPSTLFQNSLKLFLDFGGDINGEIFMPIAAVYPMIYSVSMAIVLSIIEIKVLSFKVNRQL